MLIGDKSQYFNLNYTPTFPYWNQFFPMIYDRVERNVIRSVACLSYRYCHFGYFCNKNALVKLFIHDLVVCLCLYFWWCMQCIGAVCTGHTHSHTRGTQWQRNFHRNSNCRNCIDGCNQKAYVMIYICSFFRSMSFALFLACFILSNLTIVSCRDWLLSIPHIMILIKHERMYEIKSDYFECLLT